MHSVLDYTPIKRERVIKLSYLLLLTAQIILVNRVEVRAYLKDLLSYYRGEGGTHSL